MRKSDPDRRTRIAVLERDNYKCQRCGRSILGIQYSVHHRRMRSHPFEGLNEPSNLITLCGSGTIGCHGWVHQNPKDAYDLGLLVHGWQLPDEVPVHTFEGVKYASDEGWTFSVSVFEND